MFSKVISRIKKNGLINAAKYLFVRFYIVRLFALFVSRIFGKQTDYDISKSLFKGHDPKNISHQLNKTAVYFDLNLPDEVVQNILNYSNTTPCYEGFGSRIDLMKYSEKKQLESRLKKKILLANYDFDQFPSPIISKVANDPLLCKIAQDFLGATPSRIDARLWWSFVNDANENERLKENQTVMFHYDLEALRFLYISFYISDVDEKSGAHVLVKGSHKKKRLSFLLSTANQTDQNIYDYYSQEKIITVVGKAGSGFVEDSFCYHKALAPVNRDRLLFQIRYSI